VVGFDDLNHSRYVTPALTTVRAPTEQVGRLAVERMIEILEGRPVAQTTLLPTDLVIRRSCGC
jgi:DNA-binding LacI/PurR family transcriptional regulator